MMLTLPDNQNRWSSWCANMLAGSTSDPDWPDCARSGIARQNRRATVVAKRIEVRPFAVQEPDRDRLGADRGSPDRSAHRRLEVDDRGPVDRLDRPDEQPVLLDRPYDHRMEAQRVRSVRRSRREDARQRVLRGAARMNLEDVAARLMEPCDDDDFVADGKAMQPVDGPGLHLDPGVGRS